MKNYWIVVIFLVIVTSCAKKKDATLYLPKDIKHNFSFKPGSYWIYRDSISGREDSCYVSKIITGVIEPRRTDPWPFEFLNVIFIQKPIDTSIKEQMNWNFLFYNGGYLTGDFLKTTTTNKKIGFRTIATTYPISMGEGKVHFENYGGTTLGLPNFVLGSNTFDKVSIFYLETNGYRPIYINDSVGYIKMNISYYDSIVINEVWELQRWHVIK